LLLWRVRAIQGYIGKARVARLLQLDLVGHWVSQVWLIESLVKLETQGSLF
jgi:hypothetical protein